MHELHMLARASRELQAICFGPSNSHREDAQHRLLCGPGPGNAHPRVLAKDETWVGVHALADWSVRLRLRAFVATPEFVQVRADITKGVKEAFDREGITIPFPHQVNMAYRPHGQPAPQQRSHTDITETDD